MMGDDVYILGTGMIRFSKYLEKGVKQLTGEALRLVLEDAGLDLVEIQAAWFSNSNWGYYSFQHSIRGQVALSTNGLQGIPITNVENACASGSTALHAAWTSIRAGLYDCVLAIGAEKLYDTDRAKVMMGFLSGMDVEVAAKMLADFQAAEAKRKERLGQAQGGSQVEQKPGGALGLHGSVRHGSQKAHGTVRDHPAPSCRHCFESP